MNKRGDKQQEKIKFKRETEKVYNKVNWYSIIK